MVQSINYQAIATMASVMRRPYLASPHVSVPTVSELDFVTMRDRCGIRAVVFDKDNTLTAPYVDTIHARAVPGLERALRAFGSSRVAILSNSAGTADDPDFSMAEAIERASGVTVVRHQEKKPGGMEELVAHFQSQDDKGGDDSDGKRPLPVECPEQLCVVGDRLLTDVVFGNLHGALTVHCEPLCTGEENRGDNAVASRIRTVENLILYSNWFGGRMIRNRTIPHSTWRGEKECSLVITSTTSKNEDKDDDGEKK